MKTVDCLTCTVSKKGVPEPLLGILTSLIKIARKARELELPCIDKVNQWTIVLEDEDRLIYNLSGKFNVETNNKIKEDETWFNLFALLTQLEFSFSKRDNAYIYHYTIPILENQTSLSILKVRSPNTPTPPTPLTPTLAKKKRKKE